MEEASATSPEPEEAVTWSLNSLRSWDFEGQNWIMFVRCFGMSWRHVVSTILSSLILTKNLTKHGDGTRFFTRPTGDQHMSEENHSAHISISYVGPSWAVSHSFPTFWGSGLFLEERNWRQLIEEHHSNSTVGRMRMLVAPFSDDLPPIENGYLPIRHVKVPEGNMGTLW